MSRVWDKVSEASTLMFADSEFPKTTQCMIGGRKLSCKKTSSIHPVVSTQYRLVTDRRTDRHKAMASPVLV